MKEVYEFLYCSCIHESSFGTISVHRTKTGAYKAMKKHILEAYAAWYDSRIMHGKPKYYTDKFGEHESWKVGAIQILD